MEAVKQLILKKYEIKLSGWKMGRYLKSYGYTPINSIGKVFEQKRLLQQMIKYSREKIYLSIAEGKTKP